MKKSWSKKSAILSVALTGGAVCAFMYAHKQMSDSFNLASIAPEPSKVVLQEAKHRGNPLQTCYESFLAKGPQVDEGEVVVHWMIEPSGKITSLELAKTDLNDEDFTSCLLQNIRKMSFTPPSKEHASLVAHKFNFRRKDTGKLEFR